MAGACVERMKHDDPKCHSTSKSLQIFLNDDNTYSGFCFHCHTLVPNPYGDNPPDPTKIKVKTPEEIEEEIAEVRSCPTVHFKHRAIEPEDWAYYGVRIIASMHDGKTPYAIAHPYTKEGKVCGFKMKLISKKTMWNVGDVKGADLYGWERAKRIGGSTLYITEGEEDAIALRKILRTMSTNDKYDYPVVSLPAGTDSVGKCIGRMAEEINQRFKEVVLVYDDDEPGRKAAAETRKILPHAKVARLPEKDANECLVKGRLKATRDACVFQAKDAASTEVKVLRVSDVKEQALQDPEWGVSYPWEDINKAAFGQRKGELISIGGGTGCGKTLIGHELAAWNATQHGWRTLMIMMEESPAETFKNVAGKIDNVPYHVPVAEGAEPYDKVRLSKTLDMLEEYISTWDISTIEDPETTWAQISHVIRTQGHLYDCVMIDNATVLSEGLSASERNDFLGRVNSEFANLAHKFDFEAVMFSHLNAPPSSQRPHEAGGRVQEAQFTGSRAAMRYSHMIFGFERNKGAVDPDCSYLCLIKNRKYGRTCRVKTYYSQRTGRLKQRNWDDESYADKASASTKAASN